MLYPDGMMIYAFYWTNMQGNLIETTVTCRHIAPSGHNIPTKLKYSMFSGEAAHINYKIIDLTRP